VYIPFFVESIFILNKVIYFQTISTFSMSVVRKMVSLKKEDDEFLQSHSISLSKFVRNNIEKLKEIDSVLESKS